MSHCWFNKKEILQKTNERYSKDILKVPSKGTKIKVPSKQSKKFLLKGLKSS